MSLHPHDKAELIFMAMLFAFVLAIIGACSGCVYVGKIQNCAEPSK